jgi:hypothetical protein
MRAISLTGCGAGRCATILLVLVVATALTACGGKSSSAAVGVGIGVSLTAPSGTTLVEEGGTLEIDAVVSNDVSNAGVAWSLTPSGAQYGTFASTTKTVAIYQAPSNVVGALTVTLTATSIADATRSSAVTLTINGTPTIPQPVVFPANLNIGFADYISVAGGLAPYTWAVTAGALPAGLALDGSTAATIGITGTPTALSASKFTLTVTDSNNDTASVTLTQIVNPQLSCLLRGRYAYLFTGFRDLLPVVRAGSINVASDGTLTGIYDEKDDRATRIAEPVTSGTCTTVTANRGTLVLVSATGTESFDYAVVSALNAGQIQEDDGTPIVGGGQLFQQSSSASTSSFPPQQPSSAASLAAVAGDYVFGLVGDNGSKQRLTMVGRMTLDATGVISNGQADTNATMSIGGGPLTGTLTAPDANGRGTATLTVDGLPVPLAYYVVDANTIFLVSDDTSITTPRLAGRMTRQTGAGALDATALGKPAVLSMWGSSIVDTLPAATVTAGLLSGGVGGTVPVQIDVADRGADVIHLEYAGSPYTVAPYGRGALSVGSEISARSFVLYLDGTGGGYLIEPASSVGNFGILDVQTGAPFADFPGTNYMGGSVFAASPSPITLTPDLLFQDGALSGNVTGSYAIEPATGRILATLNRNILGGSGFVAYIVSPTKIVIIGNGVNSVNSALAWEQRY